MDTTTETTTLGAVAAVQMVVTDHLAKLLADHGPAAQCVATRRHTPFGTFLLHVEVTA